MCTSSRLTPLRAIRASRLTTLLPASKSAVVDAISWPSEVIQIRAFIALPLLRRSVSGKRSPEKTSCGEADAFHLYGQGRGAAGRHGEHGHAAVSRAQRFRQCIAAIFIAVTDQQYAALPLRGKSAERQLQRLFEVRCHSFFRIDSLGNNHLVGLRGDGVQSWNARRT